MRKYTRTLSWLWLAAGLAACAQTAPPVAPVQAAAAAPMHAPTSPTPSDDAAALAIAQARNAADRAVRKQTLHVQKQLHDRANQDQEAIRAAQDGSGNERCMAGQKMRRVANGWVEAGPC